MGWGSCQLVSEGWYILEGPPPSHVKKPLQALLGVMGSLAPPNCQILLARHSCCEPWSPSMGPCSRCSQGQVGLSTTHWTVTPRNHKWAACTINTAPCIFKPFLLCVRIDENVQSWPQQGCPAWEALVRLDSDSQTHQCRPLVIYWNVCFSQDERQCFMGSSFSSLRSGLSS